MPPSRKPLPGFLTTLVGTSFGAGLIPVSPGTMGTLTAVPLAWALGRLGGVWALLAGLVVVTVAGTWVSSRFVRASGQEDDQRIVIDEVAGYLLTVALFPTTLVHLALGFGLFRLFDIWKPPPVRTIDRKIGGGFGVMADDLAAGVYAALALFALDRLGLVARLAQLLGGST